MKASQIMLALCSALLFLAGCETPCESVCQSFNDCSIDKRSYDWDCATYCGRVEQFYDSASSAGADTCQSQFDAYISCWESNISGICDATNAACDTAGQAWVTCMAAFCAVEANAKDLACEPQEEGPALPALEPFSPPVSTM